MHIHALTSVAFIPAVPAGSSDFSFAHSMYLELRRPLSSQNSPMSPSTYFTPSPPGHLQRMGLKHGQVWWTSIFRSE